MVNLIVQKKTNFIETKENTQDLRGLKAMEAEVELNSFCFKGLCVFHMVKGKCGQEPLSPFLPPGYWQMLHRLSPLSDLSVLAHFSSSLSSLRKFSAKTIFPASSPITLFLSPLPSLSFPSSSTFRTEIVFSCPFSNLTYEK